MMGKRYAVYGDEYQMSAVSKGFIEHKLTNFSFHCNF